MSFFLIHRGPNAGQRISLSEFPVTIGRDTANQIVIKDEEVSRFHCRLKKRGQIFVLEDLDSRNGCFVNGDRVLNCIVRNGDKVLIGGSELTFATAESAIELPNELLDFGMIVAEEMGVKGPISINELQAAPEFTPIRIGNQLLGSGMSLGVNQFKKIFELHGHINVLQTLQDAASTFLKAVGQLAPSISRAGFFAWSPQKRQLIPIAARHFKKKKQFILSHRAFEDVLARKQGILLQAKSPHVTQEGRNRAILPMIYADRVIMMLHLECDNPRQTIREVELESTQILINRSAANFETFALKSELDHWLVGTIETLISAVEAKDTYTRGHSERVSQYCMAIADEMKLPRETKRLLMISSLCHDVGKIGIPDGILKKASLLTAEEYAEMKLHPSIGGEIIKHMPNSHRFLSGVTHHHEKWDGTGYPDGLVGEDIPFFARIVALADGFDAMVSGRSYSGFLDQSDAIEKLQDESELFDPEVFRAFNKAYENGVLTKKTDTQSGMDATPEDEPKPVSSSHGVTHGPPNKKQ